MICAGKMLLASGGEGFRWLVLHRQLLRVWSKQAGIRLVVIIVGLVP